MKLTVRQLKRLIKEAIEEAHDDMTGGEVTDGGRGQIHHGKGGSSSLSASPKVLRLAKKAVRDLEMKSADAVLDDIKVASGGGDAGENFVTSVLSAIKNMDTSAFDELKSVRADAELDFRPRWWRRY